jgi:hypothetical protein
MHQRNLSSNEDRHSLFEDDKSFGFFWLLRMIPNTLANLILMYFVSNSSIISMKECFTYMSIEATWCDGSDDLFFEIWKRVAREKVRLKPSLVHTCQVSM